MFALGKLAKVKVVAGDGGAAPFSFKTSLIISVSPKTSAKVLLVTESVPPDPPPELPPAAGALAAATLEKIEETVSLSNIALMGMPDNP